MEIPSVAVLHEETARYHAPIICVIAYLLALLALCAMFMRYAVLYEAQPTTQVAGLAASGSLIALWCAMGIALCFVVRHLRRRGIEVHCWI